MHKLTVGLLLLLSGMAWASTQSAYQGAFQVHPKVVHPNAITGTLSVKLNDGNVTAVNIATDQPVFGHSQFPSSEQWGVVTDAGNEKRLVAVFKLQGPPHTWYFTLVSTSNDGGITFQGPIYRVDHTMDEIQDAVNQSDFAVPGDWDNVGSATLKAQ